MPDWAFTPDQLKGTSSAVPFLEDATTQDAPYYSTKRSIMDAQKVVSQQMAQLDGAITEWVAGDFEVKGRVRPGYEIQFTLYGAPGLIRVAGLPLRNFTARKRSQSLTQALLIVADWLKAAVTSKRFSPDAQPLLPFILVHSPRTGGKVTIAELMLEQNLLPGLPSGK